MGSMKGAAALIAALVPITYCGVMGYYFFSVGGGSVKGMTAIGLGPTVLGLVAFGLLFMVPVIVKVIRLSATTSAASKQARFANMPVEEEAFDADAALARYLARKAEAGEEMPVAVPAEPISVKPAEARPTFGRKAT